MKTLLMMVAFALLSSIAGAQSKHFSYVITETDTIYCEKVFTGFTKTTCKLYSGMKLKIANTDIRAIYADNKLMEKLPVYVYNKPTGREKLMLLVGCEKGIKIYRFERYSGTSDNQDVIFSFYYNGSLIATKTNPLPCELDAFINHWDKSGGQQNENKDLVYQ